MSASCKPLVHWAIYKGYKVRYTHRSPSQINGVLTTEDGEVDFEFDPDALCISLPAGQITINQHGWELSSDAQEATN